MDFLSNYVIKYTNSFSEAIDSLFSCSSPFSIETEVQNSILQSYSSSKKLFKWFLLLNAPEIFTGCLVESQKRLVNVIIHLLRGLYKERTCVTRARYISAFMDMIIQGVPDVL